MVRTHHAGRRKGECFVILIFVAAFAAMFGIIGGCGSKQKPAEPVIDAAAETTSIGLLPASVIPDEKALMPAWYRTRFYEGPATPLRRLSAVCLLLFPLLALIVAKPFHPPTRERFAKKLDMEDFPPAGLDTLVWLGTVAMMFIIPVILAWVISLVFLVLEYGVTCEGYYLPWHFVVFSLYSGILATGGGYGLRAAVNSGFAWWRLRVSGKPKKSQERLWS